MTRFFYARRDLMICHKVLWCNRFLPICTVVWAKKSAEVTWFVPRRACFVFRAFVADQYQRSVSPPEIVSKSLLL